MCRVLLALVIGCIPGCGSSPPTTDAPVPTLAPPVAAAEAAKPPSPPAGPLPAEEIVQARRELAAMPPMQTMRTFETTLISRGPSEGAPDAPPAGASFELVKYAAPPGKLAAYVTKNPGDGNRHPAIVWITGGDNNSIGDMWSAADPHNDQSAAAYRNAGIVMMVPSQRGGNDNPGQREGFLGEVEDIIAARAHLAGLPYVDPRRIYLGGHSTGGTLALLVAATTDQFRAIFSFGPVAHVGGYGGGYVYCDPTDEAEMAIRSPGLWLKDVRTPTFVIEGSGGNADDVRIMQQVNENRLVTPLLVDGVDHFAVLAPVNALLAAKIIADRGAATNIALDVRELEAVLR